MPDGFFSNSHPVVKLMFAILIIIITFIGFFFGGMLIGMLLCGISMSEIQSIGSNDLYLDFVKYLQVLQGFSLFIIPSLIVAFLFKRNGLDYLKLNKSIKPTSALLTILIIIVSLPFINMLADFNSKMQLPEMFSALELKMKNAEEAAKIMTEKLLFTKNIWGMFFNIFMIALIPAIGEELLFRGVFQRLFIEWTKNIHVGIFIAAFLFSAFHFQFYGFLPRLVLGLVLGYFLIWSNSIWLSILAHFTNNAFAVITYYFMAKGDISQDAETIGASGNAPIYGLIGFALMSLMLLFLYRFEAKNRLKV